MKRILGSICCMLLVGACATEKAPQTAAEFLQRGDSQLSRGHESQARQYYEKLLEQHPESTYKAQAQFNIAESLYRGKNYLEARFEYQKFLELYPRHPFASRAQFQIGMCDVQKVQSFDRDQRHTQEALRTFRQFRQKYPDDPLIHNAEIQIQLLRDRLAEHEFAIARFYYRKNAYHAAISRLLNLIQVYSDLQKLDEAFFMLAESYQAEENYSKARHIWEILAARFPKSAYLSRAQEQLKALPTGIQRETNLTYR